MQPSQQELALQPSESLCRRLDFPHIFSPPERELDSQLLLRGAVVFGAHCIFSSRRSGQEESRKARQGTNKVAAAKKRARRSEPFFAIVADALAVTAATAAATTTVSTTAAVTARATWSTTTTTAAEAATAATAAAAATATKAAFFTRACFIDAQCSAADIFSVQTFECSSCFRIIHFDESKALRAARHIVDNHLRAQHFPELLEQLLNILVSERIREVPHIELLHESHQS